MKTKLLWVLSFICNCSWAAVSGSGSLAMSATPLVGNIDLRKTSMIDFTVINQSDAPAESMVTIVNLEKHGGFSLDQFKPGNELDVSANVKVSPEVFVVAPDSSQLVRVMVSNPPKAPGDYFFGIKIVPTKNLGKNVPVQKSGISVPIYLGQLSAVYVHNGSGTPQVSLSCKQTVFHDTPVLQLNIMNKSMWMFRPTYTVTSVKTTLIQDQPNSPVMGESSGTRYISLKDIKDTSQPMSVTWTLKDGTSGSVQCQ